MEKELPQCVTLSTPMVLRYEEEDGGAVIGIIHHPLRGPKGIIEAALTDPPHLITRVIWSSMDLPTRLQGVESGVVREDAIVLNDMSQVFSDKTLRFLSAWQYLINTGAVWFADYKLGQAANAMMEEGFLLLGQTEVNGFWREMPGRDDVTQGTPGTTKYVEAMMGPEYLSWLLSSNPS